MAVKSITDGHPACAQPMPACDGTAGTDGGARAVGMQQSVTDASDAEHGGRTSGRALHGGVHALRRAALCLEIWRHASADPACAAAQISQKRASECQTAAEAVALVSDPRYSRVNYG